MPLARFPYLLTATFLLVSAITHAQVQRTLVTDDGNETHDISRPHPLTWWTHNPLKLDATGELRLGQKVGGRTITARDYRVQQKVTILGTVSGQRIVQVLTTIHAGPRAILWGYPDPDLPPPQWKSLLVESRKGYYEELYCLQIVFGGMQVGSAGIYGAGPNSILGTYDQDGGNGGYCSEKYWWFDRAGAHPVDFTGLNHAIDRVVPKGATLELSCWDLHSNAATLGLGVQRRDACHACGKLGTVRGSYKIQHGMAIPVDVHFEPQSE